jgi:hypothetical protein
MPQFKPSCSKWPISFRFPCTWFFSLQFVPHALPVSATLMWFSPKHFMSSTNFGVLHNAITHSSVTAFLLGLYTFPDALFSNTTSRCSPLIWECNIVTHIMKHAKLWFCAF